MFYHYKFWHSLTHPNNFTQAVEEGEIRGYKKNDPSLFLYSSCYYSSFVNFGAWELKA